MSTFEVTTQIDYRMNCLRYCPQEVIVSKYVGEKVLSLEAFKSMISTVPLDIIICFAGVSEPFGNPDCTDMILHAHAKGHKIHLFTTLVGLHYHDWVRIRDIPFELLFLHLPDAEGNARIPVTEEYLHLLGNVLTTVKKIEVMNMCGSFQSNRNEDMARGNPLPVKKGRMLCIKNTVPDNLYLMPNGNVYLCCMTRGLTGYIGSMHTMTYDQIVRKFYEVAEDYQRRPDSLCHICVAGNQWWVVEYLKIKKSVKKYLGVSE